MKFASIYFRRAKGFAEALVKVGKKADQALISTLLEVSGAGSGRGFSGGRLCSTGLCGGEGGVLETELTLIAFLHGLVAISSH